MLQGCFKRFAGICFSAHYAVQQLVVFKKNLKRTVFWSEQRFLLSGRRFLRQFRGKENLYISTRRGVDGAIINYYNFDYLSSTFFLHFHCLLSTNTGWGCIFLPSKYSFSRVTRSSWTSMSEVSWILVRPVQGGIQRYIAEALSFQASS